MIGGNYGGSYGKVFPAPLRFDCQQSASVRSDLVAGTSASLPGAWATQCYWTGKSEKSARRELFYYDETDLMAVRIDAWKMHIGVKHHGNWFDEKLSPACPIS